MSETALYDFLKKLRMKYNISNFWVIMEEVTNRKNRNITIKSYLYYDVAKDMFVWDWDWFEGEHYIITDIYLLDVLKNPNLNMLDFHYSANDIKEKRL